MERESASKRAKGHSARGSRFLFLGRTADRFCPKGKETAKVRRLGPRVIRRLERAWPCIITLAASFLILAFLLSRRSESLTNIQFENAEERVLGIAGLVARNRTSSTRSDREILIEAGQLRLFEIPSLRVDGLRATLGLHRTEVSVSAAVLSSPVGSEKTAGIEVRIGAAHGLGIGGRLEGSVSDIATLSRAGRITLTGSIQADVTDTFSIGWTIQDIRLSGESWPGADVSVWVTSNPLALFSAVAMFQVDRWGTAGHGLAASIHLSRYFWCSMGYDDASEQIKAAVGLSSGSIGCDVCVLIHPVLGISKGVFLRWMR